MRVGDVSQAGLEGKLLMTHVWFWKTKLGDRKGHPCRVLARSRPARRKGEWVANSILVEFADGFRVVTSRHAVQRAA
jgi:hypothetical protein